MIIDIRKLNAQKLYSGRMEFSYPASEDLISVPFVKFSSPVKIQFDYELYEDDAFEVQGTVTYTLEGQCSRCLQDAKEEIVAEFKALFEPSPNAEDYSYSNGIIQLKQAVDECIMTSMPFTLSCGEKCVSLRYSDEPTMK